MRNRSNPLAALLISFALALLVTGCATDPLVRVEQIERSYGVALDGATAAVDAGLIKPGTPEAKTLDAARKEADATIAQMSSLTIANQPIDRDFYIARAFDAVTRFADVLAQAKAKEAPK